MSARIACVRAEASTIPQAGAIALQGMATAATDRRVLINGAGGGSGSFAIQLARGLGAHVTGVDNAAKLDFMRSVGADDVIDYRRDDFTRTTPPYDLILDLVAHRSVFAYRRALAPGGTYRCVGGSVPTLLRLLTVGWPVGRLTGRSIGILAVKEGPAHFEPLADRCVAGSVRIHIDRGSRSTRFRPRLLMWVRDAPSAKWSSTSPDAIRMRRGRGQPARTDTHRHDRADRGMGGNAWAGSDCGDVGVRRAARPGGVTKGPEESSGER